MKTIKIITIAFFKAKFVVTIAFLLSSYRERSFNVETWSDLSCRVLHVGVFFGFICFLILLIHTKHETTRAKN